MKKNNIPFKNYIYAALILILGISLIIYLCYMYSFNEEEKLSESYLLSTNTINYVIPDLESYEEVTKEVPNDYFLFLGFTGSKYEYNIEKSLKDIIDKYKLSDYIYYIDMTEFKNNNKDYIKQINNTFNIDIDKLPAFIYVKDKKILKENVVYYKNNYFNINDVEKILDIYNYNISG